MLEYAAVLALIAGVVGVVFLATPSITQTVSDGVSQAVCTILGGEECESPTADGGPTTASEAEPGAPAAPGQDQDPQVHMDADEEVLADHCEGTYAEVTHCETQHQIDEAVAIQEIIEALAATPRGQEALDYIDENPIDVEYSEDDGCSYIPGGGGITVQYVRGQEGAAGCFVHEVDHYIRDMNGDMPDARDYDNVRDYQLAMAEFEALARVEQIHFHQELRDEWGDDVELHVWDAPYFEAYDEAYESSYLTFLRDGFDEESARKNAEYVAEKEALNSLIEKYEQGEVNANPDSYWNRWEAHWNAVNE